MNIQDKHMLLTSIKKNSNYFFGIALMKKEIIQSKKWGCKKYLFNIKSTKNANKRAEPPILSKPNYFAKLE